MRSLIIATLALSTIAASPAISASYETGYLGQVMAATGLIKREAMPTCRATASEKADALAIVFDNPGTFREATLEEGDWYCIN